MGVNSTSAAGKVMGQHEDYRHIDGAANAEPIDGSTQAR